MKYLRILCATVAGAMLFVLVCLTIAAVFMRYAMNDPLHWIEEMSGLLMVWIVFIGLALAEKDDENLSIPFVMESLPHTLSVLLKVFLGIIGIGVLCFAVYLGWNLAHNVGFRSTRILGLSWFWIYIAAPIGFLLTAFFTAMGIKQAIHSSKIKE